MNIAKRTQLNFGGDKLPTSTIVAYSTKEYTKGNSAKDKLMTDTNSLR